VVVVTLNASAASRGWNGAKDRLEAYADFGRRRCAIALWCPHDASVQPMALLASNLSARPAVLDSFSHFPHIKYTVGSYISRVVRQVPTTTTEVIAPETVSISSEGLCLYCQHKNSLLG
jgi:hypothetical protein